MTRATRWIIGAFLSLALLGGCGRNVRMQEHGGHEEQNAHEETARGPHGGRLLEAATMQLELLIVEDGIPPEYHAYVYDAQKRPLPPTDGSLTIALDRIGGRRDSLAFASEGAYFRSMRPVEEPHSYTARVALRMRGQDTTWTFTQEEGRVELAPRAAQLAGIVTDATAARLLTVRTSVPGEVQLNAERLAVVLPRFPGTVHRLDARLGDIVRAGDVLATITSNESLTDYEVRAPIAGTIVARDAMLGQVVDHEDRLFTIADLSTVWVDCALPPAAAGRVRRGQEVTIRSTADTSLVASGTIDFVGPLLEQDTRVSHARLVLSSAGGRWQPGLFVTASIAVDRTRAEVAVPEAAIVRTARGPAVFRADGSTFELQPVTAGRTDGVWTEIVAGLEPGARIVVENAFLLKAELGKSEARHDH